jgi:hypothetical protein
MTTNTTVTKAGEVTDAMVKAARVWLTHLHMKRQVDVDNAVRNAIEAALEAALPPPAEPASAADGAICHCACHNDPLYCRSCSECNCHKPDPAQSADTPGEAPERTGK